MASNASHNAHRRCQCSESGDTNKFALAIRYVLFGVNLMEEKGFQSVFTDGDCGGDELFTAAVDTCRQLASNAKAFMKLGIEQKANRQ